MTSVSPASVSMWPRMTLRKSTRPLVLQPPGDLEALLLADPAVEQLVARVAHANDELVANPPAHGAQHLEGEAQAVVERTAVRRIELVGQRRPELIHQMPVGLDLDPIEPRLLHALGGVDVILEDALDVPVLELLRECAVRGFPIVRRRDDRQPIGLIPSRPAPEMGDLDHHGCALLMTRVGEPPQPGNDLILVDEDVVERWRAVGRHRSRARSHRQRDAALRALDVIGAIAAPSASHLRDRPARAQ